MSVFTEGRGGGLASRVRQLVAIAWAKPFDTSSAEGRSRERYRRAAKSTVALFVARSVGIVAGLITVPLTLGYLGAERYGMWMTMSSLIALVGFADLGMGNGLLVKVSKALGNDDYDGVIHYVSSAFFALSGIAIILGVLTALIGPFVPWARVLNVTSAVARAEVGPTLAVLAATFLAGLPLGVVQRVRAGQQEGYVDSLWAAAGSALGLICTIVAVRARAGLPILVLSMAGVPLVAMAANGAWLFFRQRPWLRPRWRSASMVAARTILSLGGWFLILQVSASASFGADNLVLAQVLGAESVARFAVPMKLFSLIPMAVSFVMLPLWSAYADAFARGDVGWAWKTMRRTMTVALTVSTVGSAILLVAARPIVEVWVGKAYQPSLLLLAACSSYVIVSSAGAALSAFCNGAGILRMQAVFALISLVGNVGLSIWLTMKIGISGVLWGSVVAQLFLFLVPVAIQLWRVRDRLEEHMV